MLGSPRGFFLSIALLLPVLCGCNRSDPELAKIKGELEIVRNELAKARVELAQARAFLKSVRK